MSGRQCRCGSEVTHLAVSELGLHCLLRPVCPNTLVITLSIKGTVHYNNKICFSPCCYFVYLILNELALVAQLDAPSNWRPGGHGFNPRRSRQHSFVEIDHEIFSIVILSLLLIQERQLSVSGERMCTILVNCVED